MVRATSYSEPSPIFTLMNVALGVGGVVLFAGVAAGGGRLLQLGGAHLMSTPAWSQAGRVASLAGDKLLYVGKGAFLSVAVPIYAVTWVAPKWIVTVGIPKVVALYHEHILFPAIRAISKAAEAVCHFIKQPLANAAKWVWSSVIVPYSEAVAKVAEALFHSVRLMTEMTAKAAARVCTTVLSPALAEVVNTTQWVYQSLVLPSLTLIAESAAQTAILVRDATAALLQKQPL